VSELYSGPQFGPTRDSDKSQETGWSIKKFVRTARRYRTVQIRAGRQTLTATDPLPDDFRNILAQIDAGHAH
jgi:hypothetical protein